MIEGIGRFFLRLLIANLVLITACQPNIIVQQTTTVVLVRHAEREAITSSNPDPPLTTVGQQRAQALVEVIMLLGVEAIYTTQFQRTQQTAQPIANSLNITPIVFNVDNNLEQYAQDLAQDILSNHKGQAVVVVGHSDTIPIVIQALGVSSPPSILSEEFNNLFVVIKQEGGLTRLIHGFYGP